VFIIIIIIIIIRELLYSALSFQCAWRFMCALPGKAIHELTCTVSGETLNLTHSFILHC